LKEIHAPDLLAAIPTRDRLESVDSVFWSHLARVSETPYVSATEAVMGKHEVVKPANSTAKSTDRVRKHREAMRAKGYRLKSVWVPDLDREGLRARLREESRIAAEQDRRSGDGAWWDAFFEDAWADLPD
jgi:Protein  of unknown function (DUF3018)